MVHLDDTLHRDDVSGVPQAYRLFRSQALIALLHYLTGNNHASTRTQHAVYTKHTAPVIYTAYLSEVTLLNEDRFGEGNHVASFTLIHREVRNTDLSLRGKSRSRL